MAEAIEDTNYDGYPAVRLTSGDLAATFVPQLGMIGASLTHQGKEVLGQRNGLPAYEAKGSTMGIPLLYPWANRLAATTYNAAGKSVHIDPESPRVKKDANGLPMHGLLTASPHWQHEAANGTLTARLDFGAHPELLEAFPFPHAVRLDVDLDETQGLTIATSVEASEGQPVPISFGFHPYFTVPGVPREEWAIELPVKEHLVLDDQGIPTGETEKTDDTDGPLGERTFDDAYTGITGPFVLEGGGRRIEVEFDAGYPYAQVYAPEGQSLIAIEPMTAPTNALVSMDGLRVIEPGAAFRAAFRVAVSET